MSTFVFCYTQHPKMNRTLATEQNLFTKKNLSKFTVLADIQILIYITSYQKVVRRQKVENQLSPMKAHTNLLIHHGKLYLYSLVYL